ncbi:MAG TPA: hypothetical protein DHU96_03820 [Actinobacteria bacterium]|nr:hypothetical protein [Actinomycetota bacterium]
MRAAHHAYERHLASASPSLAGIGSVTRNTITGFVIGGAAGFLTMGTTGPGGPLARAARRDLDHLDPGTGQHRVECVSELPGPVSPRLNPS